MKIQFDADQQYQHDAIDAVLDLFEGQPLASGAFEVRLDPWLQRLSPNWGRATSAATDEAILCNFAGTGA